MEREERGGKNENIQIFLFRRFLHFVLDPYGDFRFLCLNVFIFAKGSLTLTLPFVRYIVTNLLNLTNINVSQNENIRLFYLFKLIHCPFLMTNQAFFSKMSGFDEGSKFQNAELINPL